MCLVDSNAVDPLAAGHHKTVVGIELAELAHPDGQIHGDAPGNCGIEILPDERKHSVSAHAAGAFKGKIAVLPAAEIRRDALWTKHGFCFQQPIRVLLLLTGAVKDAREIHIENHIRKVGDDLSIRRRGELSAMKLVHDLI